LDPLPAIVLIALFQDKSHYGWGRAIGQSPVQKQVVKGATV
jgi:hypothetical protein